MRHFSGFALESVLRGLPALVGLVPRFRACARYGPCGAFYRAWGAWGLLGPLLARAALVAPWLPPFAGPACGRLRARGPFAPPLALCRAGGRVGAFCTFPASTGAWPALGAAGGLFNFQIVIKIAGLPGPLFLGLIPRLFFVKLFRPHGAKTNVLLGRSL